MRLPIVGQRSAGEGVVSPAEVLVLVDDVTAVHVTESAAGAGASLFADQLVAALNARGRDARAEPVVESRPAEATSARLRVRIGVRGMAADSTDVHLSLGAPSALVAESIAAAL